MSEMPLKFTIWSDEAREWFFLVPEGMDLPPGDFTIYTIVGRAQQVDPDALDPFVVSRETAEAYLSERMKEELGGLARSLLGWLNRLARRSPSPEAAQAKAEKTQRTYALMADLMGESPEALRTDPQARKRGFQRLAQGMDSFLANVKAGDEDAARQQVHRTVDTLRDHGLDIHTRDPDEV